MSMPYKDPINSCFKQDVPMSSITWLHVGGGAETFTPRTVDDLCTFIKTHQRPYVVMGAGSNVLVRDGGIDAVVVRMHRACKDFDIADHHVDVGAGLLDRYVAERCADLGMSGLEFMYTIPGAIGGGVAMNAGCYGAEFADRIICVWAMDDRGTVHQIMPCDLKFGYRSSGLPNGWIVIKARLRVAQSTPQVVWSTMRTLFERRHTDQPSGVRTGGSTFKNSPPHKAWELIDAAGYRGRCKGDACISDHHCNFLINRGHSTAADLEDLAENARQAVYTNSGVLLEWELIRWGKR
jgi:UDP-N-acetylmuramate dehydrogenase